MFSVDGILEYKSREDENFYAILGCDESSTIEQIIAEYKIRALQLHPDKNAGDKHSEKQFQLLKEAKETLCDPEKKANYDKWRTSGIAIGYRQWLKMKEHVHQSMHWTVPKTKDRMLESTEDTKISHLATTSAQAKSIESNVQNTEEKSACNWNNSARNEIINKFRNYEI